LLQLQSRSLTSCKHAEEAHLVHQHQILLDKITEYYKQRAKKLWAVDGDDAAEFFQQTVIKRKWKSCLAHIQDIQGNIISTPVNNRAAWDWIQEDVTDLITNFYRKRLNFQNL